MADTEEKAPKDTKPLGAIKESLVFGQRGPLDKKGGVVVKDGEQNRFFRLSPPAAATAQLLDGKRSAAEVCAALKEATGVSYSKEEVFHLVSQLEALGLLQSSPAPRSSAHGSRSLLAWKASLLDPHGLLKYLNRWFGFVFAPKAQIAAGVLFASALFVFFMHWSAWESSLTHSLGLRSLATLYFPALLMMVFHEMAHGVACTHFGCEVHDMGVILYYLQPCTYCNVSDSWLLKRGERIHVMLAGVYAEGIAWAFFVWAAFWAPLDSLVGEILLGCIFSSGTKILLNLNPFIKLDGYYVLSDLLGAPNLRSRSFAYLKGFLGFAPSKDSAFVTAMRRLSPKQRWTFRIFAPLAFVYSVGLIGLVTWWLWSGLVGRFGSLGHLVFGVLFILVGGGMFLSNRFNQRGLAK